MNYGTPDSESEITWIPCGGCWALLHCKDVALPGYLPSQLFSNKSNDDLKSLTCQMLFHEKLYDVFGSKSSEIWFVFDIFINPLNIIYYILILKYFY